MRIKGECPEISVRPADLCDLLTQPLIFQPRVRVKVAILDRLLMHAIDGSFSGVDFSIPLTERPLGLALAELQKSAELRLDKPAEKFLLRLSGNNLLDDTEEMRLAGVQSLVSSTWPAEEMRAIWHQYRQDLFAVSASRPKNADEHSVSSYGAVAQLCLWMLLPLGVLGLVRSLEQRGRF